MKLFDVDICRTAYRSTCLRVAAETEAEARKKALAEAPNILFDDEYDYDYEVVDAVEVEDGV